MKSVRTIAFLLFAFLAVNSSLFALGRAQQDEETQPVSAQYTLLITAFDVSGLPLARQLMGETVMRNLANSLTGINFRLRGEDEYLFYRDYAWENSRADAARALAARRNERDLLLFRGEPRWRHRRDLRTVDAAIVDLEEQLAEIYARAPTVEERPQFTLSERNIGGLFPPPPRPGDELRFTAENQIDAFMTGSLSEFHGRIYLETRVFTRHTRSFSYEYSTLFSSVDLVAAVDEISSHLVASISGLLPAGLIVHATPPDAAVLVDGVLVGRGEMEMHSHFPGEVEVEIWADNYAPAVFPLVLHPGELAEVFIDLTPLSLSAFELTVPGSPGSLVYEGGLFLGETPLTLQFPQAQFAYLTVETPDGQIGTVIYRNNDIVRGNARFVRDPGAPDARRMEIVQTQFPIPPEEGRVERARRNFYRAYGATWIILPLALLTSGVALTYIQANNHAMATGAFQNDPETFNRMQDNAMRATVARTAAFSLMGASLGLTFFQIFRYLRAASTDATPLVPVIPPAEEEEEES